MADGSETCSRCRRLSDGLLPVDWEVVDGQVVCDRCLTGAEEHLIDLDMWETEVDARKPELREAGMPANDPVEARGVLRAVFGPDWEWLLIEGAMVGGTEDAEVLLDQERVVELARERQPGRTESFYQSIGQAWFMLWVAQ